MTHVHFGNAENSAFTAYLISIMQADVVFNDHWPGALAPLPTQLRKSPTARGCRWRHLTSFILFVNVCLYLFAIYVR